MMLIGDELSFLVCERNCQTCDDSHFCTECSHSYYPDNGICIGKHLDSMSREASNITSLLNNNSGS